LDGGAEFDVAGGARVPVAFLADTAPEVADVLFGAELAIVAGVFIEGIDAAEAGVAEFVGAWVVVVAIQGSVVEALSLGAVVVEGTNVPISADGGIIGGVGASGGGGTLVHGAAVLVVAQEVIGFIDAAVDGAAIHGTREAIVAVARRAGDAGSHITIVVVGAGVAIFAGVVGAQWGPPKGTSAGDAGLAWVGGVAVALVEAGAIDETSTGIDKNLSTTTLAVAL
jgi:hypothetical protein